MDERELLQRELARERAARKEAEQLLEQKSLELYHRNRDLETQVAERRRIETSLRQYGTALARSNAELEQFAYIASHDLQAPLRGIVGFSQLLNRRLQAQLGGALDADCREYLQFIEDGAGRLRDVIHDLLDFSRAGRGELKARPLALDGLLSRALAELRPVLLATGAEIHHGELPVVQGGATLLVQLLRNLIDNAIKYVGHHAVPRVWVEASQQGGQVIVSVRDNGIGIAAEHRERIFEIFQRLHTEEEYPGTGIGLAICKKIVERHDGRIWVETPAEGGSVFRFVLTAASPESVPAPQR